MPSDVSCFDQSTQTYIIYVQNEVGTYLKMVDVISGIILASTPLSNNDYFYELQVDNYDFARSFYNLSKVENRIIQHQKYICILIQLLTL